MQLVQPKLAHTSAVKRAGTGVFIVVVIFLMLLPFVTTFNELLVKLVEPLVFLRPLQTFFVGYEARLVRLLLSLVHIKTLGDPASPIVSLVGDKLGTVPIAIAWGCSGWQSMVLALATLVTAIQGNFTTTSKIEAIILGVFTTFWINILRLTTIFYLYYHYGGTIAMGFHDYFSVLITLMWLAVFWVFSYKIVLRTQES
jgi:exosortase/archaeosortase family protein